MTRISNFMQVRADGKTIADGMSVREMLALGWQPSKVVGLRWMNGSDSVEVAAPAGAHGVLVPGANFVAAILEEEGNRLAIFAANGDLVGTLANQLSLPQALVAGGYAWFEPAMSPAPDRFGAVFQTAEGSFRCDVDAATLAVVEVASIR